MKKVVYIVLLTISIMILLFNIFSILNLSFFGFRMYRIGSGSMSPYLKINDIIISKKSNNYLEGDVITFYAKDGSVVTHRIVTIDNNKIITKGDANNTVDSSIQKENIIGKVIFSIKGVGFIFYLLSKPFSWIVFFISGITITILLPEKKKKNNFKN